MVAFLFVREWKWSVYWLMGVVKTACGLVPLVPVGASDRGIILHCIFLFFGGFICFLFGCLLFPGPLLCLFVCLFCLFPFSFRAFVRCCDSSHSSLLIPSPVPLYRTARAPSRPISPVPFFYKTGRSVVKLHCHLLGLILWPSSGLGQY